MSFIVKRDTEIPSSHTSIISFLIKMNSFPPYRIRYAYPRQPYSLPVNIISIFSNTSCAPHLPESTIRAMINIQLVIIPRANCEGKLRDTIPTIEDQITHSHALPARWITSHGYGPVM